MKEAIERFIDELIKIEYPSTGEHIVARARYRKVMHELIPKYFVPKHQPQVTEAREPVQSQTVREKSAEESQSEVALTHKAKLYDLLNSPEAKTKEIGYVIQDILGFQYFPGGITLDQAMEEIEEMILNERKQKALDDRRTQTALRNDQ